VSPQCPGCAAKKTELDRYRKDYGVVRQQVVRLKTELRGLRARLHREMAGKTADTTETK
jgi:hypothetical protein